MELTLEHFETWLKAYGGAWKAGDAQAATDLFADDARYFETPFAPPMTGKQAIFNYWKQGAGESQRDVNFTYENPFVSKGMGMAQWHSTFVRVPSGSHVELDGFLVAEFDSAGDCCTFREWWHRRETRSPSES